MKLSWSSDFEKILFYFKIWNPLASLKGYISALHIIIIFFIFKEVLTVVCCDSFEHDIVEEEGAAVTKEPTTTILAEEPAKSGGGNIVWNVRVGYYFSVLPCVSYSLNCQKICNEPASVPGIVKYWKPYSNCQ